jgi:hypothetical protein
MMVRVSYENFQKIKKHGFISGGDWPLERCAGDFFMTFQPFV